MEKNKNIRSHKFLNLNESISMNIYKDSNQNFYRYDLFFLV